MMNIILNLKEFLTKFSSTLVSIFRIVVMSKFIVNLKQSAQRKEIIVLGNGPSLKTLLEKHRDFLEGKELICVNTFPNTDLYEQLKPRYVIVGGPEFWINNIDEVYLKLRDDLYSDMVRKTSWDVDFLIPSQARKMRFWKDILHQNKHINIVYYNITPVEGWKWFEHAMFNAKLGLPRAHNILNPAIYTSLIMGYKKIYLWGADHSWLKEISVDENNQALVCQKHFYDENSAKPIKMRQRGTGARKLHEILHKFMHAFASYFILREYSATLGATIINNTPGSFIDAFEREELKE